jgi:ribonuclease T2
VKIVKGFVVAWLFSFCALGLASSAWASQKASGILTAEKACPAYQSMRRQTNPGDVHLEVGKPYPVFEINPRQEGIWHRIRVAGANPTERWVAPGCGLAAVEPPDTDNDKACRTPDMYDSFVLAVSWQPAFCETHDEKPECDVSNASAYQASNFTLHGLWPNRKECGIDYGFCGEHHKPTGGFCNYPELQLNPWVRRSVDVVMPSAAAGSCLQRHEWYKHGSCQTTWTKDQYFALAAQLTMAFNGSGIGAYMAANLGREINKDEFYAKIDDLFGAEAHEHIEFKCKDGNLVDIYIHLPNVIEKSDTLAALIRRSEVQGSRGDCPHNFRVDPIGQ